jgi:hypothetical protein
MVAARSKEGPTAQEAATAHQTAGCGTPWASLYLARGPNATPRHGASALLEGLTPCRASLRLTRGTRTPERVSASLEAALDPRRRTYSPDRSIKCPSTSRAPESKAKSPPRRPSDTAWNHIPVLFHQPALYDHPRCCVGRPVSFHDTVPPTPVPPPCRPLERGW